MLAAPPAPTLSAALEQFGPHDHLCSVYETSEEQLAVAIPFIRIGLDRNEKCLYIADDFNVETVREAMYEDGIEVDDLVRSGRLVLGTKEDAYLKNERFDPEWMFTFWKTAADQAVAEGFSALRATGETEWVVRAQAAGMERWMEYESRLTDALAESNAFALCQYNLRRFKPEVVLDIIRTHPTVIYRGTVCRNFYYLPPQAFMAGDQAAREVERWLMNIREREQVDLALREQQAALQRAHDLLEIRVRERTAELSAAIQDLEAFTYSVSHDLRAPLRHVDAFATLVMDEDGERLSETGRLHLARVSEGAREMGQMINELLKLSQVSRSELHRESVPIRTIVEDVIADLHLELRGRTVEFRVHELPVLRCDPALLRHVLTNLLSNAVKFTRPRSQALIEVGCAGQDGHPAVYVRDNGIGFDMKYSEKIFGVFQRLQAKEVFEGTGIGLAIVQRIVQKHGGRAWALAEKDKGATFYFTLGD
jgi:signal transduction histidine kinase